MTAFDNNPMTSMTSAGEQPFFETLDAIGEQFTVAELRQIRRTYCALFAAKNMLIQAKARDFNAQDMIALAGLMLPRG